MTPRARRFVGAVVVLVALLFVGRWSVEFIAERWWAATISPAAAEFVSRWRLLGLALDVGAIAAASIWFAIQALLVARAIASVQMTRRLGNIQLREAVPTRFLLGGAVASGVLLGLIAGSGAHAWRDPVVLGWHDVAYGVVDPLLNLDVGVYVAQLPAWDLVQRFVVLLALLGLGFCFALYSGIGALRRDRGSVVVHPDARRHLGLLLAFLAMTVAAGYRLTPYHLAAASLPSVTAAGMLGLVRAADVLSGIALATAILCVVWALRGRNAILVAAWVVLAVAALGERYVVPALVNAGSPSPSRVAILRRFNGMAWGIHETGGANESAVAPQVTALWDEALLARLVTRDGGVLEAATRQPLRATDGQAVASWLVATSVPTGGAALDVLAIPDGVTTSAGRPIRLRGFSEPDSTAAVWRTVTDARTRPSSPPWQSVSTGVSAGSPLRRLLLAWARQAPGMLGSKPKPDLDWHLDPVERAGAILPMLSWLPADLVLLNSRPVWLVQGMLSVDHFPLSTPSNWRDARVAGVRPAVLCTVDAASGETRFYLDPAGDSLAVAWTRIVGPLIASAAALPPALRDQISYRPEWLEAQLPVLAGPAWAGGEVPLQRTAPVPVWLGAVTPALQAVLQDGEHSAISTVVTGYRLGGSIQLRLDRRDADAELPPSRDDTRQQWSHAEALVHLKDSVVAAGDTAWLGGTRHRVGSTSVTWQPVFAVDKSGPPTLVWLSTGLGDRVGGGRMPIDAWKSVTDSVRRTQGSPPDDATIVESARRAMQLADSAFRRGDMTAFGRAFEELRRALQRQRR